MNTETIEYDEEKKYQKILMFEKFLRGNTYNTKFGDHFDEYISRNKHYQKFISNRDTFLMICRLSFILGEPIKSWIIGFTNDIEYNKILKDQPVKYYAM